MQEFDLINNELETGKALIEASAGTGKTYSLTGIILRLIIEKKVPIEEILVVTYTEAATAELKTRIRSAITSVLKDLCCERKPLDTVSLKYWEMHPTQRTQAVVGILKNALVSLDKSSISTIHAFCASVLKENAFESGSLFGEEVITDESAIIEEVVSDFWRKYYYHNRESSYFEYIGSMGLKSLSDVRNKYTVWAKTKPPADALIGATGDFDPEDRFSRLNDLATAFKQAVATECGDLFTIVMENHLSGSKYRQTRKQELLELFEKIKDSPDPLFVLLRFKDPRDGYKYITQENISAASCSRTGIALEMTAFRIGSELHALDMDSSEQFVGFLCASIHKEIIRRKEQRNVVSFDDMLTKTRSALDNSDLLVASLRERYQAALIDEFQDTDNVQLAIFQAIFDTPDHRLYCVGDPKQSIYRFRGADLDTYLQASGQDSGFRKFSLSTNYRSDKGVVEAVNCLFKYDVEEENPFANEGIPFHPARVPEDKNILVESPVFVFRKVSDPPSNMGIAGAVVRETLSLVAKTAGVTRKQASGFNSVAVLVNNHQQANAITEAYVANGIPFIRKLDKSVYTSDAAILLRIAFTGILECNRIDSLKGALATPLFGRSKAQIEELDRDDAPLDREMDTLHNLRKLWQEEGFMPAFQAILVSEGVRQRLMSMPRGEEALSNYLHLAELLHEHERKNHATPEALLQFMENRFNEEKQAGTDASKIRRSTDADAVMIATVHASKGLEYDAVIVPFAWSVRSDDDAAENTRKLYVAATRARHFCTLFITQNNTTAKTALGRILGMVDKGDDLWALAEAFAAQWSTWLAAERKAPSCETVFSPQKEVSRLKFTQHPGGIDRGRVTTSFSALSALSHSRLFAEELVDEKATGQHDHENDDMGKPIIQIAADSFLPASAKTGRVLHGIMEKIDFQSAENHRGEIHRNLEKEGYDPDTYATVVSDHVEKWIQGSLDRNGSIRLSGIPVTRRLNEMEFNFPLEAVLPDSIAHAIKPENWPELEEKVADIKSLSGYLKGFIDMVFEHEGRFHIVDWKSNHLEKGYSPSSIRESMLGSLYPLQYLIYTVALDAYLRDRLRDYDYEQHFGGVFYVYLRGFGEEPGQSVFFSKPMPETIDNLRSCLVRHPVKEMTP